MKLAMSGLAIFLQFKTNTGNAIAEGYSWRNFVF